MKSPTSFLLATALLCTAPVGAAGVAAGPSGSPPPVSSPVPEHTPAAPDPPPAGPDPTPPAPDAAVPEEEERYPVVETSRAAVRIDRAPGGGRILAQVRATDGVADATRVRIARSRVTGGGGATLTVAAVDPAEFRRFAPQIVADAVSVWQRLDDGEAAVMHEHAQRLGLSLGGPVMLGGDHGIELRVGALASNGVPPVAEALVDRPTGARLGLDQVPATLLVAVEDDADPYHVAEHLQEALDLDATVVPDPRRMRPAAAHAPRGDTVWDRLAVCEASSNWAANTGNGYYGGLQFLPESWWLVGGSGMPHEASREEQIHRAERLLQVQGWIAWPVCSRRLGLR